MCDITNFDHSKIYNAKVKPLIEQIKNICVMEGIPFLCSFAVKNSASKTEYMHDGIPAAGQGIVLKEDIFSKYLIAIRGGKFIPPSNINLDADEDYINTVFKSDDAEPGEGLMKNEQDSHCRYCGDLEFE